MSGSGGPGISKMSDTQLRDGIEYRLRSLLRRDPFTSANPIGNLRNSACDALWLSRACREAARRIRKVGLEKEPETWVVGWTPPIPKELHKLFRIRVKEDKP